MSSFMVDDETLNRIVNFLATHPDQSVNVREQGWTLQLENRAALVQHLWDANEYAWLCRYNDTDHGASAPKFQTVLEPELSPFERALRAYKSLRCYMYQCSEGDAFEKWPILKALEADSESIAHYALRQTPEWEKAPWG